jgi:hypothetical protein
MQFCKHFFSFGKLLLFTNVLGGEINSPLMINITIGNELIARTFACVNQSITEYSISSSNHISVGMCQERSCIYTAKEEQRITSKPEKNVSVLEKYY